MGYPLLQSASVVVVIGPFVDDTDFKTPETGLTINAADVRISKNGGAFATATGSSTVHGENGFYLCTLATGNVGTLGSLDIQVSVAGALLVYDSFTVESSDVYNAKFTTDLQEVNTTQYLGTAITETTSGNYAANNSTFWDNGDALTTKIVDDVGTVIAPTNALSDGENLVSGTIQSGSFTSTNDPNTAPLVLEIAAGVLDYDLEFNVITGDARDGQARVKVQTNGNKNMSIRLWDFIGGAYVVFDKLDDSAGFFEEILFIDLDPKFTSGAGLVRMNFFNNTMTNGQTVTIEFARVIYLSTAGTAPSAEENAYVSEKYLASTHGFDNWNGVNAIESLIDTIPVANNTFTLSAGDLTTDDIYNGCTLIIKKAGSIALTDSAQVISYTAATRTVVVDTDIGFTVTIGDFAKIESRIESNINSIKRTPLAETTVGNIGTNFNTLFDNANVLTSKVLDNIGDLNSTIANKTLIQEAMNELTVDTLTFEDFLNIGLSVFAGKFVANTTTGNTTFNRQDGTTPTITINTTALGDTSTRLLTSYNPIP